MERLVAAAVGTPQVVSDLAHHQ
jgi:hypothetical protein